MGTESRRRRSEVSKNRERNQPPAEPTSVHDLTDDLLGLVLLGLASPVCLIRAACTCKRWRHIVADAGGAFLRRFRSLHAPPAIGHFYNTNSAMPCSYGASGHFWPAEDPVFVPSSAPPETDGRHQLPLDFLPATEESARDLADGRGSLLLLLKEMDGTWGQGLTPCCYQLDDSMVPDIIVCEPLTRRYLEIPPPTDRICILGAFLLAGDDAEAGAADVGMANFRVLLVLHEDNELCGRASPYQAYPSASVFTPGIDGGGGGWHHHGEQEDDGVHLPRLEGVQLVGRTGGRIYWGCDDKQVVVVDEHTLQFSNMALADHMKSWSFGRDKLRVVNGGGVRIVHLTDHGDLEVFSQPGGGGANDWVLEMRLVGLAEASRGLSGWKEAYLATPIEIIEAEEGLVVLSPAENEKWLFAVDLETMELKQEYERKSYTGPRFEYTLPWPPVMRACLPWPPSRRSSAEETSEKKEEESIESS